MSFGNACVYLRAGGVGLLLDVTEGRLPGILHWGADLGELAADEVRDLLRAARPLGGNNEVDKPVRVALLPEHWTGWVGRPGLSGSMAPITSVSFNRGERTRRSSTRFRPNSTRKPASSDMKGVAPLAWPSCRRPVVRVGESASG